MDAAAERLREDCGRLLPAFMRQAHARARQMHLGPVKATLGRGGGDLLANLSDLAAEVPSLHNLRELLPSRICDRRAHVRGVVVLDRAADLPAPYQADEFRGHELAHVVARVRKARSQLGRQLAGTRDPVVQ